MKLVYISHWRFPSDKTMSPLIMKSCEQFAEQGFEVELVVPRRLGVVKEDPFKYHGVKDNFKITRLFVVDFVPFLGKIGFWLMLYTFNWSVFWQVLVRKDSVYYVHDFRDFVIPSLITKKYFLEIHDFYRSPLKFIDKFVFNRARGLIVTNKIKIKKIGEDFGIPDQKMLHKPNAVDISKFDLNISKEDARKHVHLPAKSKIALYTGHLFDWKGVDTLLEAYKGLSDWEIYFLGGTPQDINNMKAKADDIGATNVKFLGHKDHDEVPYYMKVADVLVLPNTAKIDTSKYETSPVKLFEYMASKIPIVASGIPSIENIVNGNMVHLFEPDNPQDLAQKIKDAYDSSGEKVKLAFKEVHKYTWKKRIGDIIRFIYSNASDF